MSITKEEFELIIGIMKMKARGDKYEDVKKHLRIFYDTFNFPFPYRQLEEVFDLYWANTIEIVDEEKLK